MFLILACGSNGNFQLGNGSDEDLNYLQNVHFVDDVTIHGKPMKIAGGGNHTLILFEDGQVYSAGSNEYGQLGIDPVISKSSPRFAPILGKWKDVACGWEFLVLLDTEGIAWSCGLGTKGELGIGDGIRQANKPTKVSIPDGLTFEIVRCGVFLTIARTLNGQLYGWGVCRKGQLGIQPKLSNGKPRASIWSPEKLETPLDYVTRFEMGRECTYIEGKDNLVYQLGTEITKVEMSPQIQHVDQIETMWSSIHFRSSNTIVSQGNNSHGQLLNDTPEDPLVCMATGSEHGLVLTQLNKVYAWGWGEHGNCGRHENNNDDDSDNQDPVTYSKLNLIYDDIHKVIAIGGGCATSWVVIEK
ncbi:uncharacterized protein KQ657_000365 [Scheffersomyces spartinae]|uniref:RCC1-like domain-containing protein n=1 Tax=Scheffersomyces spartinae TaxID=45513 RepID=A0A9P8AIB3_9ASCO|nr:uncharacterized protein KQ657_000365 [Scheffersomyces spartinae]KAG7193678.1 hypothetical protein KQ657_000365 [Scheffersomyces spartinae]